MLQKIVWPSCALHLEAFDNSYGGGAEAPLWAWLWVTFQSENAFQCAPSCVRRVLHRSFMMFTIIIIWAAWHGLSICHRVCFATYNGHIFDIDVEKYKDAQPQAMPPDEAMQLHAELQGGCYLLAQSHDLHNCRSRRDQINLGNY